MSLPSEVIDPGPRGGLRGERESKNPKEHYLTKGMVKKVQHCGKVMTIAVSEPLSLALSNEYRGSVTKVPSSSPLRCIGGPH